MGASVTANRTRYIMADLRPMSSAPFDGTPVRLFGTTGYAIGSFWSAERSRKAFGAGDYRDGWFLLDDDTVELEDPIWWEPLTSDSACFENETAPLTGVQTMISIVRSLVLGS
jgi:hypothetical protein